MMLKIKLAVQHWLKVSWLKVSGLVFCVTCLLSAPISSQAQSQNARVVVPIISLLLDSEDGNLVTANATGILNDTGIVFSGNETEGNNDSPDVTIDQCIASTQGGDNQFARQDCSFGRDADTSVGDGDSRNNPNVNSDVNDGDGVAGFSFLKVSSDGLPMLASESPHACVKDNVTGLMWEVKTDDNGLHDKDDSYTWYNTNTAQNGGAEGDDGNADACDGRIDGMPATYCNTQAYVARVNAPGQGLCAYNDWRMPAVTELQGLLNYQTRDGTNPVIDTAFFPNTKPSIFWSASPNANNTFYAWGVVFFNGSVSDNIRVGGQSVRLVRGGQ
ncbi:MAG: hypothetical protein ACI9LY_003491 [Arenicella sp.]|jgi:hypothetical protein